jgi:putative membrane protein
MAIAAHVWFLLLQLVFWGAVIAFLIWVVLRFTRSRNSDNALSILNERFARGEIDQQEYDTRKTALLRR